MAKVKKTAVVKVDQDKATAAQLLEQYKVVVAAERTSFRERVKFGAMLICWEQFLGQSRGGIGLINFKVSPKTGEVIGAMPVTDNDSLILLTSTNKIIRLSVDEVRSVGRATMGVRLVRLDDGASVVGFDTVADNSEEEEKDA